jgi:hypothetical protein
MAAVDPGKRADPVIELAEICKVWARRNNESHRCLQATVASCFSERPHDPLWLVGFKPAA